MYKLLYQDSVFTIFNVLGDSLIYQLIVMFVCGLSINRFLIVCEYCDQKPQNRRYDIVFNHNYRDFFHEFIIKMYNISHSTFVFILWKILMKRGYDQKYFCKPCAWESVCYQIKQIVVFSFCCIQSIRHFQNQLNLNPSSD